MREQQPLWTSNRWAASNSTITCGTCTRLVLRVYKCHPPSLWNICEFSSACVKNRNRVTSVVRWWAFFYHISALVDHQNAKTKWQIPLFHPCQQQTTISCCVSTMRCPTTHHPQAESENIRFTKWICLYQQVSYTLTLHLFSLKKSQNQGPGIGVCEESSWKKSALTTASLATWLVTTMTECRPTPNFGWYFYQQQACLNSKQIWNLDNTRLAREHQWMQQIKLAIRSTK